MIRQTTLPLLFVLSPSLRADPAAALERRLRKAMLRGGSVAVGTAASPYEPAGSDSPLRVLLAAEGMEIAITTASPRIARELDLLVELDRRHSVTVRIAVVLARTPDTAARLESARRLAAEGITTRLTLVPQAGTAGRDLRAFVLEAREAGVHDLEMGVEIEGGRALLAAFRGLRLEHGFPRDLPSRG
jgi:DNA repair photolyase